MEQKRRTVKRNRQKKRSRSSAKHTSCGSVGQCSPTCISHLSGARPQGKLLLQHLTAITFSHVSRTLSQLLHGCWWCFMCQSPIGRHAVFSMYSLASLASDCRRRSAVDHENFCFFSQGMSHSYCQHKQETPVSSPKVVQDFQGAPVVPELGSPDLMQHAKYLHALCGAKQVQHSCPQR